MEWCANGVQMVYQWSANGVLMVSQWCLNGVPNGVLMVSQWCPTSVPMVPPMVPPMDPQWFCCLNGFPIIPHTEKVPPITQWFLNVFSMPKHYQGSVRALPQTLSNMSHIIVKPLATRSHTHTNAKPLANNWQTIDIPPVPRLHPQQGAHQRMVREGLATHSIGT